MTLSYYLGIWVPRYHSVHRVLTQGISDRTNPSVNKLRIKKTKNGFSEALFCWILDHPDFRRWRCEQAALNYK